MTHWLRNLFPKLLPVLLAALLCVGCTARKIDSVAANPWEVINLPTEQTMLDVTLVGKGPHGWMVGKGATILETTDGGKTWADKSLDLGDSPYNLESVSFSGKEGWIVGKPAILLHTIDEGKTWSEIPLSNQLPGDPRLIVALGSQQAEMMTDLGAIYRTTDGGRNWKAMVQESIGVVRNVSRSSSGKYVSVSSRGSYYSTWTPGDEAWQQHNRNSSRRLQNMGFGPDDRLWSLARGGQVQFSSPTDVETWAATTSPELRNSLGLLDLAYRNDQELWITGGSGDLLVSYDGGKTWQKDRAVGDVPSNFYRILFFGQDQGFVLGQSGVILRYDTAKLNAAVPAAS
jgi:photosystem II stability/assembly factor-like uncharacterized protein